MAIHWLFAASAFHIPNLEELIKGRSRVLVRDGRMCDRAMQQSHITQKDLQSVLRLKAKTNQIERIEVARLESSGEISFRSRSGSPRIVEFEVQPGVQTVRIEISKLSE